MKLYLPTDCLVTSYSEYMEWTSRFVKPPKVVLMTTGGEVVNDSNWHQLDQYKAANDLCCFCEEIVIEHDQVWLFSVTFGKFIYFNNQWYWDEVDIITGTPMDDIRSSNEIVNDDANGT